MLNILLAFSRWLQWQDVLFLILPTLIDEALKRERRTAVGNYSVNEKLFSIIMIRNGIHMIFTS